MQEIPERDNQANATVAKEVEKHICCKLKIFFCLFFYSAFFNAKVQNLPRE